MTDDAPGAAVVTADGAAARPLPVMRGQRGLWRVEDPFPEELRAQLAGESVMLSHLLYCRDYRTLDQIRAFLEGERVSHDPFGLPDMEAAVRRISQAVRTHERVAVYGDFDCDGITAAVALVETLRGCGLNPIVHIPTREDGHSLQAESIAMLADRGVTLLVTADCGITAIDEVTVAQGMGMDVIVTDHHEPRADGSRPDCLTVAPTRQDADYPFRSLCGAGVVYKVAQALHYSDIEAPDPDGILDLVALGTVADVVPLRDENRTLVTRGISCLRSTRRPGLLALLDAAGIERDRIDPVSIGFYLAPRINAANRVATPQFAYDLLTATDAETARALAARLGEYNQQRQAVVAESLTRLLATLPDPAALTEEVAAGRRPPLLIEIGDWPQGISGLLASKLVDLYGLPAFVGTDVGQEMIAVSARSVPGVRIDEVLEACEAAHAGGLFLGFGGHARAGGFRVARDRLDECLALLQEQTARLAEPDEVGAILTIDAEVSLNQVTLHAARQVRSLAPFGMGFPEPLFLARGVLVDRISPMGGGEHARLRLRQRGSVADAVHFRAAEALATVRSGDAIDVVFHLQLDEWNGAVKPRLQVRDWRPAA